ncbi:MAG TPA: hypothetical protein VN756_10560 [Solirubrobacterales bacterium]|nr:hypothetical protein [Solirubrobacterales bacterium]
MACVWLWSPDHINSVTDIIRELGASNAVGGVNVSTASPRYGTKNIRFSSGIGINGNCTKFLPGSYSEFYFGSAAFWASTATQSNFGFRENDTAHVIVRRNGTSGLLEAVTAAGVVGTGTTVINENEWHFVEVYCLIADSGGRIIVKLDQRFSSTDYEIDFTGDTKAVGTTGVVNRVHFIADSGGGSNFRITDLYFNDTTGDENNSWMGDMTVTTLYPNGAGDDTDFTPTPAVANYLNVDETSTDEDSSYNESPNEVDSRDLYTLTDTGVEVQAIFAVQVSVIARKQPAGPRGTRSLIKSGTVTVEGDDHILLDNYTTQETVHDVDPNTGVAWNKAGVDALQAGVKVQY